MSNSKHEDFCPFCAADTLTRKQLRWIEACQCFRTRQGEVTVVEADKYLRKADHFFKDLVKSGQIKASLEKSRNGFSYWINVNDAINAIRTPIGKR